MKPPTMCILAHNQWSMAVASFYDLSRPRLMLLVLPALFLLCNHLHAPPPLCRSHLQSSNIIHSFLRIVQFFGLCLPWSRFDTSGTHPKLISFLRPVTMEIKPQQLLSSALLVARIAAMNGQGNIGRQSNPRPPTSHTSSGSPSLAPFMDSPGFLEAEFEQTNTTRSEELDGDPGSPAMYLASPFPPRLLPWPFKDPRTPNPNLNNSQHRGMASTSFGQDPTHLILLPLHRACRTTTRGVAPPLKTIKAI